ncbi:nucleotide sugar dehydrogenase [bacterium]|nr:nucleotide sugar dehydrogenase [bacterium]
MDLIDKLVSREAAVGVVGLGYVGLPLAVEFADAGFNVTGVDVSKEKVDQINSGHNYIRDIEGERLARVVDSGKLRATTDYDVVRSLDAVSICVPTPLSKSREPDITHILRACNEISQRMHRPMLIVLESTSYPGTTQELVLPILEKSGLKVGSGFFLAFSPERVDPGNASFNTRNTPKIIGGITPRCTETASAFYSQAVKELVPVSSAMAAEMVKLLENTFRAINIGAINEMAIICHQLGVDVWEIIEAAKTKPFGFMPFYPGPGLGGHCIPIDPLYLSWKMRKLNYRTRFIELADHVNSAMPRYVVDRIVELLNQRKIPINGARILILGITYKRDIDDTRESPALSIIEELLELEGAISYHDPYVPEFEYNGVKLSRVELSPELLSEQDLVVVTTDHQSYDWQFVVEHSRLILDTRNAVGNASNPSNVVRL